MQDNTAQNPLNNQVPIAPSIPQTSDFPPLPVNAQPPVAPVAPVSTEPMPVIPTVALETPKKKSPLVMIGIILLVLAVIAGVAYFVGSKYMNNKKVSPEPTPIETIEPMDVEPQTMVDPLQTEMPASDSPDLIPTIPEASPSAMP